MRSVWKGIFPYPKLYRGTFFAIQKGMNHCAYCAAPLPAGAEFCPRCGKNLTVPVATAPPPVPPARRAPWWIVPLVIVGLVLIAFLVLMGLPFGGREPERRASAPVETETIAEAEPVPAAARVQTGTLVEVGEERATEPTPAPVQPPPAEEIGVSEAISTLRGFVTSRDYYGVGADCIGVSSLGYQNAGYTLEVRDSCGSRTLGRWRVDSKTRELFRQLEDGRYLRP